MIGTSLCIEFLEGQQIKGFGHLMRVKPDEVPIRLEKFWIWYQKNIKRLIDKKQTITSLETDVMQPRRASAGQKDH